MNWLDHPAVQGGIVPLVVALVLASALSRAGRGPVAWLAVPAAYLASAWLATGLDLQPLTASRKIMLIAVAAPCIGLFADATARSSRVRSLAFAVAAAAAAIWVFRSILAQRDTGMALALAAGLGLYAAILTWLFTQLREDGLRAGAAGVGLGIATGVSAVLSASLGFLVGGMAIAAGSGALLLVQVLGRRLLPPGYTGTLAIGLSCALFAEGAMLLAEMPWYALVALLVIPPGVRAADRPRLRPMARGSLLVAVGVVLALPAILASWYAARGTLF